MIISKNYMEVSFEGTAFEVGRKLGGIVSANTGFRDFVLARPEYAMSIPSNVVRDIVACFEKYCPNVNEEIAGMSSVLDVAPEDICYYLWSYKFKGACSHFGLTPRATKNHHTYICRNYEFNHDMTDCMLMDIKHEGYARNLGFSSVIFGRIDGMNEHGLAMSMTGGIPPLEDNFAEGFMFWAVMRAVLDSCKDIYEAWEVIKSMKSGYNPTYMLGDRSGNVMLVEMTPDKIDRKIINMDSDKAMLCATNHFNLESMIPLRKHFFKQSLTRYEKIKEKFSDEEGVYDLPDFKDILVNEYPDGLNAPYFSEYFGSLWSSIYDCQALEAHIRMGNNTNVWNTYSLSKPLKEGVKINHTELRDEKADPTFWEKFI